MMGYLWCSWDLDLMLLSFSINLKKILKYEGKGKKKTFILNKCNKLDRLGSIVFAPYTTHEGRQLYKLLVLLILRWDGLFVKWSNICSTKEEVSKYVSTITGRPAKLEEFVESARINSIKWSYEDDARFITLKKKNINTWLPVNLSIFLKGENRPYWRQNIII